MEDTIITGRSWEFFPPTYRAKEMKMLARWILAGEGGSVVGLAGCGRSNLLNFLCHRSKVLQSYLPPDAGSVALIPVDFNNLPATDPSTLYRVILRAFYRMRDHFASDIRQTTTTLYLENRTLQDPFLTQSALHDMLFAFQTEHIRVVLVLNHFDRFCQVATPQMLNTLRGLRDSFKDILCIIVGMAQEGMYLPDPEALGDMLYELFNRQICWVGPMNKTDARQVIVRATRTAPTLPTDPECEAMLALTGGFPALLKSISIWWLNQVPPPPIDEWLSILVAEPSLTYRLSQIWDGLTQEEQFALAAVQTWEMRLAKAGDDPALREKALKRLKRDHAASLPRLAAKGVCYKSDAGWQTMGTLLADYVQQVGASSRGKIWIDQKTEEIFQGVSPVRNISPQEDKLLRFLIKRPHKRHAKSDLIDEVWPEEESGQIGITDNHLQKLVSGLRKKIEIKASEPQYIITCGGLGYQFYPEGRPQ